MRFVPSASSSVPRSVSTQAVRRPCRSEFSRPSALVLAKAWRAARCSTSRRPSASRMDAVHTGSSRGSANSPRIVRRSERALADPTSRRRFRGADGASVTRSSWSASSIGHRAVPFVIRSFHTPLTYHHAYVECLPERLLQGEVLQMTAVQHEQTGQPGAAGGSGDPLGASPDAITPPVVDFDTSPDRYRHWRLSIDGDVATVTLEVDESAGLVPGYELKMNSYDLGVDIELYDVVQRLRFEHPEVKAVVVTGGMDRMFCAGANIRMLAQSSHAWKVNFCKFTNETRNGIEDATAHSGQTWIAAVNGTAAGGGYELALACDQILLVDDNSSAVSLPEVPLLGVLPGTGGLTRVVDKRHVRKDRADLFATKSEGIKGRAAVEWGLVDESVPMSRFADTVGARAQAAIEGSTRDGDRGVELTPLERTVDGDTIRFPHVTASLDRAARRVDITVHGPDAAPPA